MHHQREMAGTTVPFQPFLPLHAPHRHAAAGFTTFGAYSGWTPIPSAPIIGVMKDVYKNLFGVEMKVTAIHAGLECALLGANQS